MRPTLALVAGAAVAIVGAAVLGEYAFDGLAVLGSGVLLGLFVSEAVITVRRGGSRVAATACAALTAGSLVWAAWISTGHRLGEVGWKGWAAVGLGAGTGAFRARLPGAARHTPATPASAD